MGTTCQSARPALKKVGQTSGTVVSSPTYNKLTKKQLICLNALYGALDGLSISYSLIRCYFDVQCASNGCIPTDLMHDWMMTPEGIAVAVIESIAIISLSLISNVLDNDNTNKVNRFIVLYGPYFRDAFKALKNTYRSICGTFKIINTLTGQDIQYLALPIGVALGVLSMLNRAVIRSTRAKRTTMVNANLELLRTIQASLSLNDDECQQKREQIKYEAFHTQALALSAAAYGGLIDGIYLYMGILSLAPITYPILILSIGLSLLCIASRLYEIHTEQLELHAIQAKIKLALCGKELQTLCGKFQLEQSTNKKAELMSIINLKLQEFKDKSHHLHSTLSPSYISSALAGMRGGLAAYGAITSSIFALTTVSISFPPAFVLAVAIAGLVCVCGFITYLLCKNYMHHRKNDAYPAQIERKLSQLRVLISENNTSSAANDARTIINEAMEINASSPVLYQEWFEIWRSLFSSPGKGQKSVDFTLFRLQERDEGGHYKDTPLMLWIMAVNSIVYAAVLSLRAYVNYDKKKSKNYPGEVMPRERGESEQRCIASADSPATSRQHVSVSILGFFKKQQPTAESLKPPSLPSLVK